MSDACDRCNSMLWRPATYICNDPACRYGVTGPAKVAPTRPSDRAIAQAFWELSADEDDDAEVIGIGVKYFLERARQLDATAAPVVVVTEEMVTRGTLAYLAQIESQMTMTKRINPAIKAALTAALAGDE